MKFLVRDLLKYISKHIQKKNKPGNILNSVVLCNFTKTFIVTSKEENSSYRNRCTRVQVNNKRNGDEFKRNSISENIKGWGGGFHLYYFVNIL